MMATIMWFTNRLWKCNITLRRMKVSCETSGVSVCRQNWDEDQLRLRVGQVEVVAQFRSVRQYQSFFSFATNISANIS